MAKRVALEPSFETDKDGHCVMYFLNAGVSSFDIPGILQVLSWPASQVRLSTP